MSDTDTSTCVDDDELILRRIPIKPGWYDPTNGILQWLAFRPTKHDTTGLSVTRAKSERHPEFLTPAEDAAMGQNSSGYYVAVLCVGELRQCGIDVVSIPEPPHNPGHAELPQLTKDSGKTVAIDIAERLAETLTIRVEGPFLPLTYEEQQ